MCCKEGTAVIENWNCEGKIVKLQTEEQMAWDDEIVYTEAGPTRTMAPRPKQTTEEIALPEVESNWTDYYQNIVGVLDGMGMNQNEYLKDLKGYWRQKTLRYR